MNEVTIVRENTFKVIQSAVNKLVDLVRLTYGPAGNKVIIQKMTHRLAVDDGVQVARDFELSDPSENAVINLIRETAVKTNDRVGDGTTSSMIMLQGIIQEVARRSKVDGRKVEMELKKGFEDFKANIQKAVKEIKTKEDLKKVALVSFDNPEIAEMIASLYFKLGKDGVITIDKSPSMKTTVEMTEGIKIDTGYLSPYMITNPQRMEASLEKPYILITDYRLTQASDILPIMEKLAAKNIRELVIIAENVEQSALSTAVVNRLEGKFAIIAIPAPKDENRKVLLEDIALLTGAKMFTESKGDKLEEAEITDLGRAGKFVAKREESVIVDPKGNKKDVQEAIAAFKEAIEAEPIEKRKKEIENRLALFTNKFAVIKVGAATENEQKALRYKVEDAVNAVKAAYKNGVVCGSGLSLSRVQTSSPILNEALKYPHRQLLENMGIDSVPELKDDEAFNVVTGKTGNFMAVGVVDPVDVLIAGVESAVSIASILVTSCGIIVESKKEE